MLYHTTPWMCLVALPVCVSVEGALVVQYLQSHKAELPFLLFLLIIGAIFAFGTVLAEYSIVKLTSSIVLNVVGLFKEIITIVFAVALLDESLTALNILGLVVSIIGIALFNVFKYRKFLKTGDPHSKNSANYTKLSTDVEETTV